MKGFILCAGLGSRLKPWSDSHPKALVPVEGVPMLSRVLGRLNAAGVEDVTVNVHHFADQIEDYIKKNNLRINISDERGELLETGGALLHAAGYLEGDEPILVHNADILSNADIPSLTARHFATGADITLLVSERESSRKLLFDEDWRLIGWHSEATGEYRPAELARTLPKCYRELAFSGIYVISPNVIAEMRKLGWSGRFSIMDFMLSSLNELRYMAFIQPDLKLLDIGKPEALARANIFLEKL